MAVAAGLVRTVDDLALFLAGRVRTAGLVLAGFASAALSLAEKEFPPWADWDRAFSARTPSASLRAASRAQGAALLRTASRMWPTAALDALRELGRPHQPLVLGVAVAAGGGTSAAAAALAVHHLVGGACSAAVRLLGLDPLAVAATQAALAPLTDDIARKADSVARNAVAAGEPALLPATGAAMPELLAARHFQTEVTLFAS
jgi:urease accessory protein